MTDKFERQKSTRWVEAKMPSYGDDWGVDYNEEQHDQLQKHLDMDTTKTPQSPETVQLPSDTKKMYNKRLSDSDELKLHAVTEEEHVPLLVLSLDRDSDQAINPPALSESIEESVKNSDDSQSCLENVINLQHDSQNQPSAQGFDTSLSSEASDNDSIQQEPEKLNLGASRQADSATQTIGTLLAPPPEPLVLSIDRMNLNSNDMSSDEDDDAQSSPLKISRDYDRTSATNNNEFIDQAITENLEKDDLSHEQQNVSTARHRHRVKTEALDSLINDLLQLERLSLASLSPENERESPETLPPGLVLADLPHTLTGDTDRSLTFESPASLLQKHHSFMSDYRDRRASIRKAPPLVDSPTVRENLATDVGVTLDDINVSGQDTQNPLDISLDDETVNGDDSKSVESNGSLSTGSPSFDGANPTSNDDTNDVCRKDSTVSSVQFSMGSWRPNTNVYRDKFVNNNDLESHMNISMLNEGESGYTKFTGGMRPVSGYAESFANSSCISVPDTIEANLHSINELQSDGEDPSLEIMSMTTARESTLGQRMSSDGKLVPSILGDYPYGKGKFEEKISTENVDEKESETVEDTPTKSIFKPGSLKAYPVSNWKKIMSTSQAIDRIQLLKKALEDEEAYDTGLQTWLNEALHSTEQSSSNIQIGVLATQAYKNATHNDLRRHTSLRSKVSMVKDKMDVGASFGRRFLSKGKKLMKSGSD